MNRGKGKVVVLPGGHPRPVDEAKVVELRKYGLTHKQIMARLGISEERVSDILKRHALNDRSAIKGVL